MNCITVSWNMSHTWRRQNSEVMSIRYFLRSKFIKYYRSEKIQSDCYEDNDTAWIDCGLAGTKTRRSTPCISFSRRDHARAEALHTHEKQLHVWRSASSGFSFPLVLEQFFVEVSSSGGKNLAGQTKMKTFAYLNLVNLWKSSNWTNVFAWERNGNV